MENSPPGIQTMPSGAAPGGLAEFATVSRKPAGKASAAVALFAGLRDFATQTAAAMLNASKTNHGQRLGFGAAEEGRMEDFFGIGAAWIKHTASRVNAWRERRGT